jgi:hypothetical protein
VDWRIAAGTLITGAALLGALQTFLGYAERAAEYRTAGAAYGRLRREFDMFLLKISTGSDRARLMEDLSELCRHIDELGQQSPLIPPLSYRAAKNPLNYAARSTSQSSDDFHFRSSAEAAVLSPLREQPNRPALRRSVTAAVGRRLDERA